MKRRKLLSTPVIYFGMVSFFTDVSTEMMRPIIPLFVVEVLGGSPFILGFISGLAEAVSYGLRFIAGILAGITRRYWALTGLGYFLSTISKPLTGAAPTWHWAALTISTDRVGKAIRTPARDTLLSSLGRKEVLGRIFGIHRFLDQMGAVLGPLITTSLLLFFVLNYRTIIYLTAIPGLLSVFILWLAYKRFSAEIEIVETKASFRGFIDVVKELSPILILIVVYGLGFLHINFLIDRARAGFLVTSYIAVLLYCITQLFHAFSGLYFGKLLDRLGLIILYVPVISLVLASIFSLYTVFPICILLSFILYGVHEGVYEVSWRALVGKIVDPEMRSVAYGLYHMVFGFSILLGSLIVGYLYEHISYSYAVFYVVSLQLAVAAILTLILKRKAVRY